MTIVILKGFIISFFLIFISVYSAIAQQWGDYTLYSVQNGTTAILIDTNNTTYHTWTFSSSARTGYSTYLMPGGTIVRTVNYSGNILGGGGITGRVQKVDWNGNVTWDFIYSTSTYCLHHDICPLQNGNVLMISYEVKTAAQATQAGCSKNIVVWSEKIIEVQPTGTSTGTIVWEWHAWDHLCQNFNPSKDNYVTSIVEHPELLNINYNTQKDWMHMNGIDYNAALDQITFSSHMLNEIYVIDHSTTTAEAASHSGGNSGKGGDILYRWGNPAAYGAAGTRIFNVVHDAHWVPSDCPMGNYLAAFNNKGGTGNKSCVDLISPPYNGYNYSITLGEAYLPSTYTWRHTYTGSATQDLGNSQQLPNGNMLICISQSGYICEIDPNKNVIWSKFIGGISAHAYRYSKSYIGINITPPSINPSNITVPEDSAITSCSVITDPDEGSSFTASSCKQPLHGSASFNITNGNLCITYTPDNNYNGRDTVCVIVCDNTSLCDTAKVPLTITSRPDNPNINIFQITVLEDSSITVSNAINDPDEGSSFTAYTCSQPSHGNAIVNIQDTNLLITYTPVPNYFGKDTICVVVCDNTSLCDTVYFPVVVSPVPDNPIINPGQITVSKDSTINSCSSITDLDGETSFTSFIQIQPKHGNASTSALGGYLCINYSPTKGYFGNDTLSVIVCDNASLCDTAVVPIVVTPKYGKPEINISEIVVYEDSTVKECSPITGIDGDVEFDTYSCGQPSHGEVLLTIEGKNLCIKYSPEENYSYLDTICVVVCDKTPFCDTAFVELVIIPVPDKPIINPTEIIMPKDTSITNCSLIIDADEENQFTAYSCNHPLHGTVSYETENSELCITYKPLSGYIGRDTICVVVCDDSYPEPLCDSAIVPVLVTPGTGISYQLHTKPDDLNSMTIYPNPSSGVINISGNNSEIVPFEIIVYNLYGSIVARTNMKDSIDLSALDSGIYFISLKINSLGVITKKITLIK